ncbi:hypothetical protein ACH5RR_033429 [Cinchona calisaya]|uniref:F-box domain-containing protein n=1 Tax=Cinchona calisaya TaxID=153742 RepID=A0ABD2YKY0_9GENT
MMKRLQNFVVKDSLPKDVALNIVSCLEVTDVCSLGSCSNYWREICESDCIWKSLCEERWPGVVFKENDDDDNQEKPSTFKGWRGLYVKRHNEMAGKVDNLRKALCCQAMNVNDYLKAIKDLNSMKFGFRDVQILLLQPKIHVLLNLVGLHFCIKRLGVQVDSVNEAISSCKIQDRQVDIHWWMNGGWLHRFRLPDVLYSHCISLKDLTKDEGEEILGMLDQGITRLLVRLQISAAEPKCC